MDFVMDTDQSARVLELLPAHPRISMEYHLVPRSVPDSPWRRSVGFFWSAEHKRWFEGRGMTPEEAWDKGYRFLMTEHA